MIPREPIAGIRKNVVPSVPAIEPAVENAIHRAGHAARTFCRAQQEPYCEWRTHAEKGHRNEHQAERCDQAASANIVNAVEREFENRLSEARQHQQVAGAGNDDERQNAGRDRAVGQNAAYEITSSERD